jgi:hypothetical protein
MLHRAHRAELLSLAQLLRVNPDGLGLGDLARILAGQVRRIGSHGIGNVARGGHGRPYELVLADAARERGITPGEPEETELALARSWFASRWEKATPEERERVWKDLGLEDAPPEAAAEAAGVARERLGRAFDYAVTGLTYVIRPIGWLAVGSLFLTPLGCLARPVLPLFVPYFAWRALRPSPEQVGAVMLEVARIRQRVLHRVTIGVVGSPSTGKDAGIKALFGIDTGNISPIAGSTKEVAIQRLPGATALFIVNTPGLGDVMESVTEEARQVLDHIDLYLYIVNAEGGVQARELADYQRCVATGKPVRSGSRRKSWNTQPMARRRYGTLLRLSSPRSRPPMITCPDVARSSRMHRRMKVDLPDPDCPTRKTNSPAAIDTDTPSSPRTSPS